MKTKKKKKYYSNTEDMAKIRISEFSAENNFGPMVNFKKDIKAMSCFQLRQLSYNVQSADISQTALPLMVPYG